MGATDEERKELDEILRQCTTKEEMFYVGKHFRVSSGGKQVKLGNPVWHFQLPDNVVAYIREILSTSNLEDAQKKEIMKWAKRPWNFTENRSHRKKDERVQIFKLRNLLEEDTHSTFDRFVPAKNRMTLWVDPPILEKMSEATRTWGEATCQLICEDLAEKYHGDWKKVEEEIDKLIESVTQGPNASQLHEEVKDKYAERAEYLRFAL